MALRQGKTTGYSINKIVRLFGIDRKTVCRWIIYFREHFPKTVRWQRLRGRLGIEVKNSELPTGLLHYFFTRYGSDQGGLIGCLHFLATGN
jgi:hypothetical protein